MSTNSLSFIYRDASGNISLRTVTKAVRFGDDYLQCYDSDKNEVRTFRRDRILEIIEDAGLGIERLDWYRKNSPPPLQRRKSETKRNFDHSTEVCFTGFKKEVKKRLTDLAEKDGFYVCSGVTKNLDFLVCGYNAVNSVSKKKKANQAKALILSKYQFTEYLSTGEIPENSEEGAYQTPQTTSTSARV